MVFLRIENTGTKFYSILIDQARFNRANSLLKKKPWQSPPVRKMKLLTHNMLTSKCLKGVTVGYPLAIEVGVVA